MLFARIDNLSGVLAHPVIETVALVKHFVAHFAFFFRALTL